MKLLAQSGPQTINLKNNVGLGEGLKNITPADLVSGLIRTALVLAAVVFFFMLVIGGIKWIASGGDKGATETARNQITAALVGLVIVFAAWAISYLINAFFGVDIFNLTISSVNTGALP
jgi:hypothetical protein